MASLTPRVLMPSVFTKMSRLSFYRVLFSSNQDSELWITSGTETVMTMPSMDQTEQENDSVRLSVPDGKAPCRSQLLPSRTFHLRGTQKQTSDCMRAV